MLNRPSTSDSFHRAIVAVPFAARRRAIYARLFGHPRSGRVGCQRARNSFGYEHSAVLKGACPLDYVLLCAVALDVHLLLERIVLCANIAAWLP